MPTYSFQMSAGLAGSSVSVTAVGSSTVVASGTLDANAQFTASLPVADYVATAAGGHYSYRSAGTVAASDPDQLADLSSTFARTPKPILANPKGLRRWRTALADAAYTPAVVTVYGDSITQGNNADNSVNTANSPAAIVNYRDRGWVGQLRNLFANGYGTNPGEGYVLLDLPNEARIVTAGGVALSDTVGPHMLGYSIPTGGSIKLTVPAGTAEVDILQWWQITGPVPLKYSWDAVTEASATVAPSGSGSDTWNKVTVTVPDANAHTLNVFAGTATVYLSGFQMWAKPTATRAGVVVNRMGKPGQETFTAAGSNYTTGNRDRIHRATFQATSTNLAVLAFGANDYWYQDGAHGGAATVPTPAEFKVNLQGLIDSATNGHGKTLMTTPASVLLFAGPRRQTWDTTGPVWAQEDYYAKMRELSDENDHVAFLDLKEAWGDQASAQAAGMAQTANVHPLRSGHGDIARIMYRALTSGEFSVTG